MSLVQDLKVQRFPPSLKKLGDSPKASDFAKASTGQDGGQAGFTGSGVSATGRWSLASTRLPSTMSSGRMELVAGWQEAGNQLPGARSKQPAA